MTRKQRKQLKRQKRNVKSKKQTLAQIERLARYGGKIMTSYRHYKEEQYNRKYYCGTCRMEFCIAFDGGNQYCHDHELGDCPFVVCCTKETQAGLTCRHCEKEAV